MTVDEALDFLKAHQPMPDFPAEVLLQRYRAVTSFFFEHKDPRCIPLFLGSFAQWDDWSIYDSVQSVLRQFNLEQMVPHLRAGLGHESLTLRTWSADTARFFPHPLLVEPLAVLLREDRPEVRLVAASALEMIPVAEVVQLAENALSVEEDEDVLEVLRQILAAS